MLVDYITYRKKNNSLFDKMKEQGLLWNAEERELRELGGAKEGGIILY